MRTTAASLRTAFVAALYALLLAVGLSAALPGSAQADVGDGKGSLTVHVVYDETAFANVEVYIHHVANIDANNNITPIEPYSNYSITWNITSDFEMGTLASTLEGYTARDDIDAGANGPTSTTGEAQFTGLECGVYLILAGRTTIGNTVLEPTPVVFVAPTTNETFHENVHLKFNTRSNSDPTSLSAVKAWVGSDANRPTQVEVQLLCDGEVADTAVLNADNGWTKTWRNLSPKFSWRVVEAVVPDDYEVSVVNYGETMTIRNTYVPPEEETPPPAPSVKPPAKLPQTGQLWWPVPALAGAGLMLLALGLLLRRRA